MSPDDAFRAVAMLAAAYPSHPVTQETLSVYARMLQDLDRDDVGRAIAHLIATNKFFSTVAEIRQTVAEQKLALPTPLEAWEHVRQLIKDNQGIYARGPVSTDYPEINCVINDMGYRAICTGEAETVRMQFMKLYAARRAQAVEEVIKHPLALSQVASPLLGP